ncbi:uncharacterized protein LOC132069202 [Lycium ferocissimum]|uniref:uncharacterized protein LOC132069202 n=1 Tax=Lycium ferocissimum TaxID=112874 RepID=UPI002816288D|nr:uncharacterized protein LOC132069202 [Lycium ferocissimum]
MTCSKCHTKGHNKRRCFREPNTTGPNSSNAVVGPNSSNVAATVPHPTTAATVPHPTTAAAVPNSSNAAASTSRGRGRPKGSKKNVGISRPSMVGMGVLHTQSGQTIINPGLPSQRFRTVKSSAVVTGVLGHKATCGVKWKGKDAMTSRQLGEMRGKMAKATQSSQGSSTTPL